MEILIGRLAPLRDHKIRLKYHTVLYLLPVENLQENKRYTQVYFFNLETKLSGN